MAQVEHERKVLRGWSFRILSHGVVVLGVNNRSCGLVYIRVGRFSLFWENHMLHFRFHCGWPLQATFSFIDFWFDEFFPGGVVTYQKTRLESLNSYLKRKLKNIENWMNRKKKPAKIAKYWKSFNYHDFCRFFAF